MTGYQLQHKEVFQIPDYYFHEPFAQCSLLFILPFHYESFCERYIDSKHNVFAIPTYSAAEANLETSRDLINKPK